MKARINYRSKRTIIIISIAVVLLIAAIAGTVAFVKGNKDAAAAMTDDGTSTSQNDGANAGLPNNGDQNNGDDQNNNGTTLPEVGDNTNPADSNNNGNNGSTTNGGTTGTNGANGSNTGANAGTTTGTTTTGNNGANVPNQDYTQTTVIPGRDNVLVEQNTEIGWSPINVAAYTAASKLKVHKPDLDLQKYAYLDGDSLEELPVNTAVQKGETITYVIKITNNGNEDANGIRTIDSIPEGTELASISEGGALNNDGKIVWKNDIKAGGTVTVSFKVVVTANSIDLINNIAKVNGEETPETKTPVITANKTAQVVTIVDKEEVLENRDAKVGETIRYTITAKNTTEVDGTTVIKDSIPDGTSFVDGTITEKGNFDKENGTITWNNVVVPAKGEVSVSFDVVVNEKTTAGEVVKSVSNTATIGNTSTEEVETKVANITGEKEVSDKVANVGDTLTYTIILTNNGNGNGKVTVTDAIPKGTKIKVATTDGYDLETNTMTWKNVEVKAGKSVELTLEVVVEDNISIIKNTAYVDGNKIPEEPETSVKHHYTVEHYTENLDGTYSKVEKDTVVSEDVEIGTKVSYKINNYEGFTFDDSKTENKDATVPDNNNLVVKLYYTRNSYKVTYEYEGKVPTGASALPTEKTYKYGASVTVAENATAPGYTFSGWDKKDFTMPANDVVIKGSFKANDNTQYKVEHYLEDLDDKTFTLKDTETLVGTTDTTATATPKQYPGFTFNENVDGTKTSGTITGDGQLVLKLYYTRNTYKYTVHYFYNGVEEENKADEFEALYEEKINEYTIKNQGIYTEYNKESSNRTKEALLVIGTGSNYINIYYGTPNVTISKNVNKTAVKVGDTLHYTIKVTETRGFVDASGVNVTDTIPEGLENIRNITQNGVVKGSKIEWNNLAITKNSSITLEFDATVSANTIGKTISNTANLGGSTNGDSNTVTTTVSELKAAVKEVKKGTTGKDAVNIVLVMDLSYSMQEKKTTDNVTRLEAAKTAATKFINSIYTKDPESKVTVTVLTFNTKNPVTRTAYVGNTECTAWHNHDWNGCKKINGVWYSDWEETTETVPYSGTSTLGFADKTNYSSLVSKINAITLPDSNPTYQNGGWNTNGLGTDVSAALTLTNSTVNELKTNYSENSNVVILLSDGAPTTSYSGNSSSNNYEGLRNQASEIKGNPITTEFYSIQFGTEKGAEKLLKAMSSNNTVYTSNSIDSLVKNFTNILDQNTTKDPIDTVNGKYTTTLSNPLVVDADNPITVTYEGTTLFTCTSLPNNGLTYDSTTKTITWDINAWNAVKGHTKVTTNNIVIQCYVER